MDDQVEESEHLDPIIKQISAEVNQYFRMCFIDQLKSAYVCVIIVI